MKEKTLKQFCDEKSQQAAADIIGCTQGAVWQMIKNGREIYIVDHGGKYSSYERKQLNKTA